MGESANLDNIEVVIDEVRRALSGRDNPGDDLIASLACERLAANGMAADQPVVGYIVDAIRTGPRRAARRLTLRALREQYRVVRDTKRQLRDHKQPSYLTIPDNSEWIEWGSIDQSWIATPVLHVNRDPARAMLQNIFTDVPLNGDPGEDPPPRRAFQIWFDFSEGGVGFMAGRVKIGHLEPADERRVRPIIESARAKGGVPATSAFVIGDDFDQMQLQIELPAL